MESLKIYLAGKMGGLSMSVMNDWRHYLKKQILHRTDMYDKNVNVINPVDYYNFENMAHQNEFEVMQFDINKVKQCDLIIAKASGLNTSIGTSIEIYEASKRNIPVLLYDEFDEYENIHPWLKCCITRIHKDSISLIDYIEDFYLR